MSSGGSYSKDTFAYIPGGDDQYAYEFYDGINDATLSGSEFVDGISMQIKHPATELPTPFDLFEVVNPQDLIYPDTLAGAQDIDYQYNYASEHGGPPLLPKASPRSLEKGHDDQPAPVKKSAHLVSEKRRRDVMKNTFSILRELILTDKQRQSKACVIEGAATHIEKLNAEINELQNEKRVLQAENQAIFKNSFMK